MLSALYFIRRRTQILFPVSILFKNVSYGVVLTPILWGIYRILDLNYSCKYDSGDRYSNCIICFYTEIDFEKFL